MNYQKANALLQGRNMLSRKTGNNTYLVRNSGVPGDSIHLKLHNTYVVTWYADGRTELNTGGWRTVTTKDRINNNIEGFQLRSNRGQWYVYSSTESRDVAIYEDGMSILPDGTLQGVNPLSDAHQAPGPGDCLSLKLRRKIQSFASRYMQAFKCGDVPAPGPGDCLYCAMRTVDGNVPLGESIHDKDHILSHIEEDYFVPSLLYRAFETRPHSQAMGWTLAHHWQGLDMEPLDFTYDQLQKSLGIYILRQIGQAA